MKNLKVFGARKLNNQLLSKDILERKIIGTEKSLYRISIGKSNAELNHILIPKLYKFLSTKLNEPSSPEIGSPPELLEGI